MPETYTLTIGDPTGIGPEITAKFLQDRSIWQDHRLIIIGDIPNLREAARQLNLPLPKAENLTYKDVQPSSRLPGQVAYDALELAVKALQAGEAQALITGPLSKENLQNAELPYSGHTEILQHLARKYYQQPCHSEMLFLYRNFRMLLLTRHVPLRKVSECLSVAGVARALESLVQFLQTQAGITHPRLCLLGVNPHAGELEGDEEERFLKPAITLINQKYNLAIEPPVAADAAFRHFDVSRLQYDAYVAAYHDQGLIPFKMVAGMQAVNVTIGLPFLRTSVSHGTAPDIAGQGIADPSSLAEAFRTAVSLTTSRAMALH